LDHSLYRHCSQEPPILCMVHHRVLYCRTGGSHAVHGHYTDPTRLCRRGHESHTNNYAILLVLRDDALFGTRNRACLWFEQVTRGGVGAGRVYQWGTSLQFVYLYCQGKCGLVSPHDHGQHARSYCYDPALVQESIRNRCTRGCCWYRVFDNPGMCVQLFFVAVWRWSLHIHQ
jgi:hypothetical protein